MTTAFKSFIKKNEPRIAAIGNWLKDYKIDAKKIGIRNAKERVILWLENFDKIGFQDCFRCTVYFLSDQD